MSSGFALIYGSFSAPFIFSVVKSELDIIGVNLANPLTKNITRYNDEGDQIVSSLNEILEFMNKGDEIAFQCWITDSTDIYCRIRRYAENTVFEFGLDGLADGEKRKVVDCMKMVFEKCVHDNTILGMVIDLNGSTEEVDWDAIFLSTSIYDKELPDLFAIKTDQLGRIRSNDLHREKNVMDGHTIIQSPAITKLNFN